MRLSLGHDPWGALAVALLAAVGTEIFWLGMLWPMMPSTPLAWTVTLLLPIPIAAYAYLVVRLLLWLSGRLGPTLLYRGLAIPLAVSVGVVIFALLLVAERKLGGQYHYAR
jgi:hypothetical protein